MEPFLPYLFTLASSIASAAAAYAVMRTEVTRLKEDVKSLQMNERDLSKEFVTHKHFETVLGPIQRTLEDVQHDVKKILISVVRRTKPGDCEDEE